MFAKLLLAITVVAAGLVAGIPLEISDRGDVDMAVAYNVAYMEDLATGIGCGTTVCCEPKCRINVKRTGGCIYGFVDVSGNCEQNRRQPPGKLDLEDYNSCGGYAINWFHSYPLNSTLARLSHGKSPTKYDFRVDSCGTPRYAGSCAYKGGGCEAKYTGHSK